MDSLVTKEEPESPGIGKPDIILTMEHQRNSATNQMPDRAPMSMPTQVFTKPFNDPASGRLTSLPMTAFFRWIISMPAALISVGLMIIMADWFKQQGLSLIEITMMSLVGCSSFFIGLSLTMTIVGLCCPRRQFSPPLMATNDLKVALVMPIYNEDVNAVATRIHAMRRQLQALSTGHQFAIFILSDSNDDNIIIHESERFGRCNDLTPNQVPLYYRRRSINAHRKVGNIRQWIENWGAAWDAFVVLDADSLMTAKSIQTLADEMAKDTVLGLIQTVPRLTEATTLFAKVQQFSSNVYGSILAQGLDRWSGNEANYWGHNAIIRTKAFAQCAGLPTLNGKGTLSGVIKSHDFVEAALLRRAGWGVRIAPFIVQSYEESPQSIIDHVLRDRRWCQGNLQHIRLLLISGLHSISRFHLFQGAMAYIASVFWFVLLVLWTLMGRSEKETVFVYFTEANPLFPQWPEMDAISRLLVLCCLFGLLIAPKLITLAATAMGRSSLASLMVSYGGLSGFLQFALVEILLSILIAPIMMVQHVLCVFGTLFGFDSGWTPQNRTRKHYSFITLLRFHYVETIIGILLTIGLFLGVVSLWLLPIATSLILAVPISYLSSLKIVGRIKTVTSTNSSALIGLTHPTDL